MAMRGGGRGGRFGGRGGRGSQQPQPVAKNDDGTVLPTMDEGPPPLFPQVDLPPHPELDAREKLLLNRKLDISSAAKHSVFLLNKPTEKRGEPAGVGPERLADRETKRVKRARQPLSAVITLSKDYFPEELFSVADKKAAKSMTSKAQDAFWRSQAAQGDAGALRRLELLAKAETAADGSGVKKKEGEDEEAAEEGPPIDEDDEEDMEQDDYYQGEAFDDDDDGADYDDGGDNHDPTY